MNRLLKYFPMQFQRFIHARRRAQHSELSIGEKAFFELIQDSLSAMADVGARTDTYYSEQISLKRAVETQVWMFEANPIFAKDLESKLSHLGENNHVINVGIGHETAEMFYYYDTQSFVPISKVGNISRIKSKEKIEIRTLDSYCDELPQFDFLKTDIEEFDFFALLGAESVLSNVHFLQFELGIGVPFKSRSVSNQDYWDLLEPNFHLYILNDDNPIWRTYPELPLLIYLDDVSKRIIRILQSVGAGFNIVGISKKKGIPNFLERQIAQL